MRESSTRSRCQRGACTQLPGFAVTRYASSLPYPHVNAAAPLVWTVYRSLPATGEERMAGGINHGCQHLRGPLLCLARSRFRREEREQLSSHITPLTSSSSCPAHEAMDGPDTSPPHVLVHGSSRAIDSTVVHHRASDGPCSNRVAAQALSDPLVILEAARSVGPPCPFRAYKVTSFEARPWDIGI